MNDSQTRNSQTPTAAEIYKALNDKLRNTAWASGAAEAHGLLSALACCGVTDAQLPQQARLFRLSGGDEVTLLQGMYGVILQDLHSDEFEFNPLLPADEDGLRERIDALAEWCIGFMQGVMHDGERRYLDSAGTLREAFDDILAMSRIDGASVGADAEKQLFEIEQYLRVAVKVVFEELSPPVAAVSESATSSMSSTTNQDAN